MNIGEFLIALGVKADTDKLKDFDKGLEDVADSAEKTESSLLRAYDATDGFVSAIEGALGVIGFFTGILGGALGMFHSTITELETLIDENKLLTKVTKEQIDQSRKYTDSVDNLGKRWNSLRVELAMGFLPTLQRLVNWLDNVLKANKDLIVNGITVFLNTISRVVEAIANTVRFIDMIVDRTLGWKNTLLILVGVLAFVKRAMIAAFITNPITWIVAAIAGLILLIDDFMTYLDGGDSLFAEYWGGLLKWIESVKEPLIAFKDAFIGGFEAIKAAFFGFIDAFSSSFSLADVFGYGEVKEAGEETESTFTKVLNAATAFFKFFSDNKDVIAAVAYSIGAAFSWMLELLIGVFSGAGQAVLGFVGFVKDLFDFLVALFSGNTDAMAQEWQEMTESAMTFFSGLIQVIGQILDSLLQVFGTTLAEVGNYFKSLYDTVVAIVNNIISYITEKLNSILSIASSVVSGIGEIFSGVFDAITAPFGRAFDWVSSKWGSLKGMITSGISSATAEVNARVGAAVTGAQNSTSNFYGGNVQANINVMSPNPQQAANNTVKQLQKTTAFANKNLKGAAKA